VLSEILQNELERALLRRGLRTRQWAVEWEDSAFEFQLSQGFTPELGVGPLKRVIDRSLLSPLAITLVEHQAPQGDQFLFVRSDGSRIMVEFIDPSGEAVSEQPIPVGDEESEVLRDVTSLRRLMLHPSGSEQEVRALHQAYKVLSARIEAEDWRSRKENALQRLEDPDFWSSETRFAVLGTVEYLERIQTGLQTARSLTQRFFSSGTKGKSAHSPHLISRLSLQLYLLQEACDSLEQSVPKDAFLKIEAVVKPRREAGVLLDFAERLCRMYLQWAGKRHMRVKLLQDERQISARRFLLVGSGFGAYSILAAENGIHVFEVPEKEKGYTHYWVQVGVITCRTPLHCGTRACRSRPSGDSWTSGSQSAGSFEITANHPHPWSGIPFPNGAAEGWTRFSTRTSTCSAERCAADETHTSL
jgi:ATP-dependent Clp protease ATP-binding subunit ClpC